MLGDHLLGEIEGLGEGVDGGRAERELVHHGAARWVGQGRESQAEIIHNRRVVKMSCGVKRAFGDLRVLCPLVAQRPGAAQKRPFAEIG